MGNANDLRQGLAIKADRLSPLVPCRLVLSTAALPERRGSAEGVFSISQDQADILSVLTIKKPTIDDQLTLLQWTVCCPAL